VRASIVVSTRNRSRYLREALASVAAQGVPADAYEVIVVDNGSSDDTAAVVRAAAAERPNVRYVAEPEPGAARARNAGLRAARAPVVAFLDDDAVAGPAWLATILDVFATVRPTPGCAGGPIRPRWEAARPAWLADELLVCLPVLEWSAEPRALGEGEFLASANMAFPRELLAEVGGFPTVLGPAPGRWLYNEDVWVQHELRRRGHAAYWHPAIAVEHHVPGTRLVPRYFTRRYYAQGVSDAVLALLERPRSAPERLGLAWRHARRRLRMRSWAHLVRPTWVGWRMVMKCGAAYDVGYATAMARVWRWRAPS
jgi:glycosyltransferase involved in cell wall biosynthesis